MDAEREQQASVMPTVNSSIADHVRRRQVLSTTDRALSLVYRDPVVQSLELKIARKQNCAILSRSARHPSV